MKADLHVHGPISFSKYWLKNQGYSGKNILELMTDRCIERGIDICAVTSDYWDIPKELERIPENTVHDRFSFLQNNYLWGLPKKYKSGNLGKNAFVVEKENKQVYFVNGQTVHVLENGKEMDHLVIGTNQVPFWKSIKETTKFGRGTRPILHGAEHPLAVAHRGIGRRLLEENIENYDFIEGHNSQLIFHSWIPILNKFPRKANEEAQKIADEYGKPWIATTDANRTQDIGISYIESQEQINLQSDESIILSLENIIKFRNFENVWDYEPLKDWINFVSKCYLGVVLGRGD